MSFLSAAWLGGCLAMEGRVLPPDLDAGATTEEEPDVVRPSGDGADGGDCPSAARFVYYLTWSGSTDDLAVRRFDPATNRVEYVGPFGCTPEAGYPLSLAADRHGHGWTVLRRELDIDAPLELRGVDLRSGRCDPTGVLLQTGVESETLTASLVIAPDNDGEETIYLLVQEVLVTRLYRIDPSTGTLAELGMVGFLDFSSLASNGAGQLFVLDALSLWSSNAGIATLDPVTCRSTPLVSLQVLVDELWGNSDGVSSRYLSQGFVTWGDSFYLFLSPVESPTASIYRVTAAGTWERVVEDTGGVSLGAGVSSCAPYELF